MKPGDTFKCKRDYSYNGTNYYIKGNKYTICEITLDPNNPRRDCFYFFSINDRRPTVVMFRREINKYFLPYVIFKYGK